MLWTFSVPRPKFGDTRVTRKFAWLPTVVQPFGTKDESTQFKAWLEFYNQCQEYVEVDSYTGRWENREKPYTPTR